MTRRILSKPLWRSVILMIGLVVSQGPALAEPADLPGHYYLSGMHEVGSELLLRTDGRFSWMLAYGALDMALDGRWSRDGDIVTLLPDRQDSQPLAFKLAERTSWNERATRFLAYRRQYEAVQEREKRCPLTLSPDGEDARAVPYPDAPSSPEERRRVAANLEHLRQSAQATLDKLDARADWQADRSAVANADAEMNAYNYARARNNMLDSAPLALPEECKLDDWEAAVRDFRGVAVYLFDGERYQRGDGLRVEARYDGGAPSADAVVDGYAFLPLPQGKKIVALAFYPPDGEADPIVLSTDLPAPALQRIDANLSAMVEPPFEQLRLTIGQDGELIPLEGLYGAYRKAP